MASVRNLALMAAFAAISCIPLSGIAFAHAHLEAAQPPVGATVTTAPAELDLKFSEALNQKFTGVKVTGPDGKEIKVGEATFRGGDKALMVNLPPGLGVGTYKVEWQALSRDGHKTRGNYTFTVKP